MNVKKVYLLIVLLLLITLSSTVVASGADGEQFLDEANLITDGVLKGLNENNYLMFSENFNQQMKAELSEAQFNALNITVKAKIGDYVSKQFVGLDKKDQYKILTYFATYTQEQQVVVRTVVVEENSKLAVAGFWLDSPKLRK
ncbi:DUF3887 domain-containing protein [Sporomusa sp.]|uniref:DUF3887 domain-containing protein n=1 Tax=Sporomusa sp. TaxID=2078658 RepID=UPI002CC1B2DC|nr:DUF3887 domain-containing protein [Sporomusa sp.]HWR06234.1 DUF3887 domain-containing protein [Sporomusa sp.]